MSYPIAFEVKHKLVVVVGGGQVATRRVARLLEAGASVKIVAPRLSKPLRKLADDGQLQWHERGYRAGDLDGATLVLATTDDAAVNRRIANTARSACIPVNVADSQTEGDFAIPAVAAMGPLRLAIDTGGASPAISAALRRHLESNLSAGWIRGTEIAGRLRAPLQASTDPEQRRQFWRRFADDLPDKATGEKAEIRQWLETIADDIGIDLPDLDDNPGGE